MATETHIELYDVADGNLRKLYDVPIYATITALESFRLENSSVSFLAMTSDSGNLTIAQFHRPALGCIALKTILNQPITRSQLRRVSPISFMSVDPYGRCLLLSAMEKNKLCFVLNSNTDGTLMLQSPLEAIRPDVTTLDVTSCDVQYDNPCFAAVEIEAKEYHLVFYILDLGLNHIVKRADYKLSSEVNFLMGVPALSKYNINCVTKTDETNPFVLIGFEGYLLLKDMNGFFSLKVQLPNRIGHKASIITGSLQLLKKSFFILLQSNFGDLYKLTIEPDHNDRDRPIVAISYFDTIFQAEKLHIFKNGYLYANSEMGDSHLFQFDSLGEDSQKVTSNEPEKQLQIEPSNNLNNLSIASTKRNLNPLLSTQVTNSNPLTLVANSHRTLTNGVKFEDNISSPLPPGAENIWNIKVPGRSNQSLLLIAFDKMTMILEVENGTIEELNIPNNPFKVKDDKLLHAATMGEKSIIQVCENELRQIVISKDGFTCNLNWFPPAGIRIVSSTNSQSQLALGLSNNEIAYFEISSDSLHELQDRIEFDEPIASISVVNSHRSDFLAVGSKDSTVKIVSLKSSNKDEFMEVVSIQTVLAPVSDIMLVQDRGLELHVGLQNGIYYRSKISSNDGQVHDVRTKFLGSKSVTISHLQSVSFEESSDTDEDDDEHEDEEERQDQNDKAASIRKLRPCVLLHCNGTWISYTDDHLLYVRPVLSRTSNLTRVCEFMAGESSINGCCAISSSGSLAIGKLKDFVSLSKWFLTEDAHPIEKNFGQENGDSDSEDDQDVRLEAREYDRSKIIPFQDDKRLLLHIESCSREEKMRFSVSRGEFWYNFRQGEDIFKSVEGSVITASLVKFSGNKDHLVVSSRDSHLKTFEIFVDKKGRTFDFRLLHSTPVEDKVASMIPFSDKLLVPIYGSLILFGLGKKQLLKQSISETTPSLTKITALANWQNQRIAVGDARESVTLFLLDKSNNKFVPIADDIVKRHVTSLAFLDASTVLGGDKFGNVWTLRLKEEFENTIAQCFPHAAERLQDLPLVKRNAPNIMECPFKLNLTNMFYINDIPINIHVLNSLQISDRPAIVYTGLQGTVGCLVPLLSRAEITTFTKLEHIMSEADDKFYLKGESEWPSHNSPKEELDLGLSKKVQDNVPEGAYSIVGRDHLKYRSYYGPVRNIVDGDLCERFFDLSNAERTFLCNEAKALSPEIIIKYLNDIRTNCI